MKSLNLNDIEMTIVFKMFLEHQNTPYTIGELTGILNISNPRLKAYLNILIENKVIFYANVYYMFNPNYFISMGLM